MTKMPSTKGEDSQAEGSFDSIFSFETATSSDPTSESDVSEYGNQGRSTQRSKKRKVRTKQGGSHGRKTQYIKEAAPLPEMSDDNLSSEDPSEFGRLVKNVMKPHEALRSEVPPAPIPPTILQLHIDVNNNNDNNDNASRTINFDMTSLLHSKRTYEEANISSEDLQNQSPTYNGPVSKRRQLLQQAKAEKLLRTTKKTGFLDLPYEVREDIYRHAFVRESAIDFTSRVGFSRSAAFLRTCRKVYNEGREILYGENSFHFRRCHDRRGPYWASMWGEVGFKDVRRFLEDIGSNLSLLQYVSFSLFDAAPSSTPHLTECERRFVNDPILHHVFDLMSHAHLLKFAFECTPRRSVSTLDYHFLRSLGSIRAQEVIYVAESWGSAHKVSVDILRKLKQIMTLAKEDENEIDQSKKKKPRIKMHHEREKRSRHLF